MRVFISQPMANRDTDEIMEERTKIMSALPETAELIDTLSAEGDNPLKCLGEALILLADADLVVFAENWHFARGCKIEHEAAYRYGIPVRYASDLLT